jgi:hypothetical protein
MSKDINLVEEFQNMLNEFEKKEYVRREDFSLVGDFLRHDEPQVGLEVLCDILRDYQVCLREADVKKIQCLAKTMNLEPYSTWELLTVFDEKTQQPKAVLQDENFWQGIEEGLLSIVEDSNSKLLPRDAESVREYVDAGEYVLALEDLVSCYTVEKLKISRKSFETLVRLLADFDFPQYDESNFIFDEN